jgi:FixJ family two-component response regulator
MAKVPVVSIIDDDRSVRNATDRLVRSLGFIAYTFPSAEDFLRSPHVAHSSCLIADIRMPNMTGTELQQWMTANGHDTPIIFVTAFPEESIRSSAMDAGAVAFLSKPFDGKTMIKCLASALKRSTDGPVAS